MKESDITKTGPMNARQLLELNALSNDEFNQYLSKGMKLPSLKEITRNAGFSDKETPVGNIVAETNHGESRFDPESLTDLSYLDEVGNTRGLKQPWYSKLSNGVLKGTMLAGTTFLDGTIGLVTGLGTMAEEGKWRTSALWDNPFSQAMKDINEWSEKNIPNYYTDYENEAPFHKNIFSANFIGDKFIKNLGFTVGAFYSGGAWTAPLKGAKVAKLIAAAARSSKAPGIISSAVGTTLAAVNEGRIEALNNSTDWANLQEAKLNDEYKQSVQNIKAMYGDSDLTDTLIAQEDANYEEALTEIGINQAKMGNANMLFNLPILMAGNIIQFGKMMQGGFNTARRVNNIRKIAKNLYAPSVKGKTAGVARAFLNPLAEGVEEMSQSIASTAAGEAYEGLLDSYYKKKKDPYAEEEAINWIKLFGQAINENVNDNGAWEEFFIGSLTGALGMPSFGKSNTSSDQTWLGKNKSIGLSGGIIGELIDQKQENTRAEEMAQRMTNTLSDPENKRKIQKVAAAMRIGEEKQVHLDNEDPFEYKNSEHLEFFNNISAFDDSGHLGDFVENIEDALSTDDANLEALIENTTEEIEDADGKKIQAGPFIDEKGNRMNTIPSLKEEMIEKINKRKENLLRKVDDYVEAKKNVDRITGQKLSDDQLEELAWLQTQISDWEYRGEEIATTSVPFLEKLHTRMVELKEKYTEALEIEKLQKLSSKKAEDTKEDVEEAPSKIEKELASTEYIINTIEKALYKIKDDSKKKKNKAGTERVDKSKKEVFTSLLKDPFIATLMEEVSRPGLEDGTFTSDEVAKVKEDLKDLNKIKQGIIKYNKRLEMYYQNPNMLADDIEKAEIESLKTAAKEHVAKMSDITTLKAFKERIANTDNRYLLPYIYEAINESDNNTLKNISKNYDNITEDLEVLKEVFNSIPEVIKGEKDEETIITPAIKESIVEIMLDAYEDAETSEQAEDTIAKYLLSKLDSDNPEHIQLYEDTKKGISYLMNQFKLVKKAKQTSAPDTSTPEKAIRKKGAFGKMGTNKDSGQGRPGDDTVADTNEDTEDVDDEDTDTDDEDTDDTDTDTEDVNDQDADDLTDDSQDNDDTDEESPAENKQSSFLQKKKERREKLRKAKNEGIKASQSQKLKETILLLKLEKEKEEEIQQVKTKYNIVEEAQEVPEEAQKELNEVDERYEELKGLALNPSIALGSIEANSNIENNVPPSSPNEMDSESMRSWRQTLYDFNELTDKEHRRLVKRDHPLAMALNEQGAFDFVDSGKLGRVIKKHPDTPIKYIVADKSDKVLGDLILLALEWTDKVSAVAKTPGNLVEIDGKSYQIVGVAGYSHPNSPSGVNEREVKNAIYRERAEANKTGQKYFVSEIYDNKVKHLYSGRMVKSTDTQEVSERDVDEAFLNGTPFHLGFYYGEDDFRTPTISSNEEIEPLNTNNPIGREGSVWLMTLEADGVWYAKAVGVKRFTHAEYPLAKHANAPIILILSDHINTLIDPNTSSTLKLRARDMIEYYLYFPKDLDGYAQNRIVFHEVKGEDGKVVDVNISVGNRFLNIGQGKQASDKAFEILKTLQNEELNLRFLISPRQMSNKSDQDIILKSRLLTTDLYQPTNVNASFDMYLNDLNTGKPVVEKEEGALVGHTGRRGINSAENYVVINSLGKKYRYNRDTEVFTDTKGNEITDSKTLSHLELRYQIATGAAPQIEGTNIYSGRYENGRAFGILNGKILTSSEIETALDKLKEKKASERRRKNVETVKEALDGTNKQEENDESGDDSFRGAKKMSLEQLTGKKESPTSSERGSIRRRASKKVLDDIDDGPLVEDSDSESDESFRRAAKKMSLDQLTGGTVEDAAKEVENTAKEVVRKRRGNKKQEAPTDTKPGKTPAVRRVGSVKIVENFATTSLRNETQEGTQTLDSFLRNRANREKKQQVAEKLLLSDVRNASVTEIISALDKFAKENPGVVPSSTLTSIDAINTFINNILECK